MKIIRADNFAREYISESLIAENVSEYWAKRIVKLLNENTDHSGPNFFRAESDDYKLYVFEP